jgi:mono/diheme cytochrome c family protein
MIPRLPVFALFAGAALAAVAGAAAVAQAAHAADAQVRRGAYIVNDLGGCGDCHTPHGPNGPVAGRTLMGADLPFAPIRPIPGWNPRAPRIAGLPNGMTRADVVRLLETGRLPNGTTPRPPMPAYRMTPADAQAVAAYLASLDRRRPPTS